MKKYLYKCRLFLTVIFLLVCVALITGQITPAREALTAFAEEGAESSLIMRETETDNVKYAPLERTNYAETDACYNPDPEADTNKYTGFMGENATKKTKDSKNKNFQLYFSKCFSAKKKYEISFYAKSVGAANDFYVKVWYAIDEKATKKEEFEFEMVDGEWTKFSFTFTANDVQSKLFKLTLEPKNGFEEIYYDQFSAVLVEDGYQPYICGERFTPEDWTTAVDGEKLESFNGEEYPAAVKLTTGALTSKIFETPSSGILRLRFAMEKTAGASVTFSIRNALGDLIDEGALGKDGTAYYDIVTSDLSENDFVTVRFDVICAAESDYALIGALEMVEHTHDTANQSGYPKQDFANCKRTDKCGSCEFELVSITHSFEVEKEATCVANGSKVCQNQECGLRVTIPATGEHVYEDKYCSIENERTALRCLTCNGARIYLLDAHDLVCISTSETEHHLACSVCSYVDTPVAHAVDGLEIAKMPTATEGGYAVTYCEGCKKKHGKELAPLEGDGASSWIKSVVTVENCTQTGVVRYTLVENEDIWVELETEALGHTYEAIKKMPTCTEDGVSLHHVCVDCGYVKEKETEIKVLSAYGHTISEWVVEKTPTLEEDGFRKNHCTRCGILLEEQVIPKLDEVNYTKYALDDHDEKKGFYYYYESAEWGTYSVYVKGSNKDAKTIWIIGGSCVVVVVGSVTACVIVATKTKRKRE